MSGVESSLRRQVLGTLLPGFVGTSLPPWVAALLAEGLGGVCLFGENIVSTGQLRALTAEILAANPAALIAIDEEGGDVTRLHYDVGSPYPGNAVLGRLDSLETTRAVGVAVGAELRAVGVNLDFAPDVDVNSNPSNPVIGIRSFGASAALVSRHGAAWTAGLQSQGVAACLKHFPGHGDTAQDSHLALPTVDVSLDTLRERELPPFRAAIEAGALSVMTSHILLPQVDAENAATFSPRILEGLLRGELGFGGVIVSDALDMAGASAETGIPRAAVRALAAGCDLLCIGTKNTAPQLEEIVATVRAAVAGEEPEVAPARIAEANGRVAALVAALAASASSAGGQDARAGSTAAGAADAALVSDVAVGSHGAVVPVGAVADSFAVDPAAGALLRGAGWLVVRVETTPNNAVGTVPWGPFDALRASGAPLDVVTTGELSWRVDLAHIPAEAFVLVVGKDNARRSEVRALVDALRERQPRVVTVDLGWPGAETRYAEVATHGASALVGEALAAMLAERGVRS